MCLMKLSRVVKCFKEVSGTFQEIFKDVSRKIEWCFNGPSRGFQGYLKKSKGVKEVSRLPQVSREF